jgi:hypothetical protein
MGAAKRNGCTRSPILSEYWRQRDDQALLMPGPRSLTSPEEIIRI